MDVAISNSNQNQRPLLAPRPPKGEEERVATALAMFEKRLGFIPDAVRLYSLSPTLLEGFATNIAYFNSGERISPKLMAMIRYLVSSEASCKFCIDLNESFLVNMGVDLDKVRASRAHPPDAPVEEREKPLLRIALKTVSEPENVSKADIDAAHEAGWTDREIFDVAVQAANNRALNFVLRAFKVERQGDFA